LPLKRIATEGFAMKALKQLGYTNLVHLATSGEGEVYICEKQGTKYIIKVVSPLENEQLKILNRVNALRNEYFPRIVNIINNASGRTQEE
jgi:hypothetical protein